MARSGGLREQEAEIERLGRNNFSLKLRVHHLEEQLNRRSLADAGEAAAELQRECIELRVGLSEARGEMKEKDELLRRARQSIARLREASEADRRRADALGEDATEARAQVAKLRHEGSELQGEGSRTVDALRRALAELEAASSLARGAERRLAASSSARGQQSRSGTGAGVGSASSSLSVAVVGGSSSGSGGLSAAAGLAAGLAERTCLLRTALVELSAAAAESTARLEAAEDRALRAERRLSAASGASAPTGYSSAGADVRPWQGEQGSLVVTGAAGAASAGASAGAAGAAGSSRAGEHATVAALVAAMERAQREAAAAREEAAGFREQLAQACSAAQRHESNAESLSKRAQRMESRCADLTERLGAHGSDATERAAAAEAAARRSAEAEAAAEARAAAGARREVKLADDVARLSRRVAEAETGWGQASLAGDETASNLARAKAAARSSAAEATELRKEASRAAAAAAAAAQAASERAERRVHTAEREASRQSSRIAALQRALLGPGGALAGMVSAVNGPGGQALLKDGSTSAQASPRTPQRRTQEIRSAPAAASPGRSGMRLVAEAAVSAQEALDTADEARRAAAETEADRQVLRALGRVPPLLAWVRDAVSDAETRQGAALKRAEEAIEALSARLEQAQAAAGAASRAAAQSAASARSARSSGRASEETRLAVRTLEDKTDLLEEALAASAARGEALEESNRLLALELGEKADRLTRLRQRGIAATAAGEALESCVDRLGLIARESARLVESAREARGSSSSESLGRAMDELSQRVAGLAGDTLEALRPLASLGPR